eukprot:3297533-Amphidinium_carterae.1
MAIDATLWLKPNDWRATKGRERSNHGNANLRLLPTANLVDYTALLLSHFQAFPLVVYAVAITRKTALTSDGIPQASKAVLVCYTDKTMSASVAFVLNTHIV